MLLLGLDAFCRRRHAQALGEGDDGADDRHRFLHAARRALHEAAVDLDRRKARARQIAEAGIAGAEIVQAQPDAERQQLFQNLRRAEPFVQEHAFGDLQLQPFGGQARIGERGGDDGDELRVLQLVRRHVDRDADGRRPLRGFGAGGPHDPFADRPDQARFLGKGHEFLGRDQPQLGVAPAQQRLETGQPPVPASTTGCIAGAARCVPPPVAAPFRARGALRPGRAVRVRRRGRRRGPHPWRDRGQGRRSGSTSPPSARRADRSPGLPTRRCRACARRSHRAATACR